jgi:TolB protein
VQLAASSIPWDHVGPGWLLATWNRNKGAGAGSRVPGNVSNPVNSMFLVDPAGGRYLITRYTNDTEALAGWSGDGRRALLVDTAASTRISQIDLATGRRTTSFTLPTSNSVFFESVSYTRPKGLALLVTTQTNDAQLLQRYSLTGSLQHTYPTSFTDVGTFADSVLSSPDGLELALGTSKGVAFVDNDGTVVSQVRVPGASYCGVKRWWETNVVLVSCAGTSSQQRLYEVPLSGGAATPLTATPSASGGDQGDENAWAVGSAVYVQDAGGCGYQYLARLQPDDLTKPVTVPDVVRGDSVFVLGAANDELALEATVACGSGQSALWFNPSKHTSSVVLGPPLNGGGVQVALSYPDPMG